MIIRPRDHRRPVGPADTSPPFRRPVYALVRLLPRCQVVTCGQGAALLGQPRVALSTPSAEGAERRELIPALEHGPTTRMATVRWVYRVETLEPESGLQEELDALGLKGWELVAVLPRLGADSAYCMFIFKHSVVLP